KSVTSWYSSHDRFQHVAVAAANGDLTEIHYDPTRGIFSRKLGNQGGTVSLAGYYNPGDAHHYVFALARFPTGSVIYAFRWSDTEEPYVSSVINAQGDKTAIATYMAGLSFIGQQHLVVTTGDGNVTDYTLTGGDSVASSRTIATGLGALSTVAAW